MKENLFTFIWKNSKAEQIRILLIVLISFPFYYFGLTLPKYIVTDAIQGHAFEAGNEFVKLFATAWTWPSFLGGGNVHIFDGVPLRRVDYLFALSAIFLFFVIVNSAFKYLINMKKSAVGETLLRLLRFELFSQLLSFTPEALRHIKAAEAAANIKDDVEPIGMFVGDAFVAPIFLGGQAATALLFIILQSHILGFIAAVIVTIQGTLLPKLQRLQFQLGKDRQIRSRELAGNIGETIDCISEVSVNGTQSFEQSNNFQKLQLLFLIRCKLFSRKFSVKLTNNILSEISPFLFYTIGGYFALRGDLGIGQLVAVIAAYRDLPGPVREMVEWDEKRLDAEVKYQQIREQFSGQTVTRGTAGLSLDGPLAVKNLKVLSPAGDPLLDRISLSLPRARHILFRDLNGDGARTLAQILGRRITVFEGTVTIGDMDINALPDLDFGRNFAYVGPDPIIFDGTLRDNILYGLKRMSPPPTQDALASSSDWIDYAAAAAEGPAGITKKIIDVLDAVGLTETVFRFGLTRRIAPVTHPTLPTRVTELRSRLRERLNQIGAGTLIEPFDPDQYADHGNILENILFGVALDERLSNTAPAGRPLIRRALERAALVEPLIELGQRLAATMIEIFQGVSADHILFGQFAFLSADEFPIYEGVLIRAAAGELTEADRERLIGLALNYVEPRHRLGFLTPDIRTKSLEARRLLRTTSSNDAKQGFEFYDPTKYCAAAPLRDNLLFGHVTGAAPSANQRVDAALHDILKDTGLLEEVFELGLDQATGYAGRYLFQSQKIAVVLARALIKRPKVLILNEALGTLGQVEATGLLREIRKWMANDTLIVAGRRVDPSISFDMQVDFEGNKIKSIISIDGVALPQTVPAESGAPPAPSAGGEEVSALRAVSIFAELDVARLKLLAFASERVVFQRGEVLFNQGATSDAAYTVISGSADVIIGGPGGPITVSSIQAHEIVGEMGIITGDLRSATVVAREELVTLRLRKEIFLALMAEFPQMALAVTQMMIKRIQDNASLMQKRRDPGDLMLVAAK